MGRALVVGVVLVMLGAAVSTPGAVLADGDDDGGSNAIEYADIGIGSDSPVPHILALNGDGTLSDEDDDDEDGDDDDEDGDDDDEDGEDDDDEDGDDDDEDGDDDDEDGEDDDDEDGDDDDEDGDDDDDVDEEDDDDVDDEDGDANSDDEQTVDEWVGEIFDTVTGGENSTHSDPEQPITQRPMTSSMTTLTKTDTPTPSPTPTHPQTTTATESPAPATFDISNPTVDDSSLDPGETLRVVVQVENVGEQAGTFDGQLRVDGAPVDTASSTLDGGEIQEVVFEHRFDAPGEYELAVDEMYIGTVNVTEPTSEIGETPQYATADADERLVQVVDAEVPADWVRVGARTTVRATVVNTANRTVDRTLSVTIDGDVVGNETVSLQPYERRIVSIEFVAADGKLSVEGLDVGTIDIRGYESGSITGTVEGAAGSGTDTSQESFVLVALLGLLLGGVGLLFVTRH